MFPAMLPPPTPFKLFALAGGGLGDEVHSFPAGHFCRRFVRFLVLSILTLIFGPQFVRIFGASFRSIGLGC